MKILSLETKNANKVQIDEIVTGLKKGSVVVLPTDTIYGLSCLANNSKAIKQIKDMKGKDSAKALIILVSSIFMLKKYVYLSKEQEAQIKKFWNLKARPTTVILKHKKLLPKELSGEMDSLALRLPKSDFLIKIIKRAGVPLVSTSLNLSGQPHLSNTKSLQGYFKKNPDLVIDAGTIKNKKASRLVNLSLGSKAIFLRK